MNRMTRSMVLILVLGASFMLGLLASNYQHKIEGLYRKPIVKVSSHQISQVTPETSIILEKDYTKCQHIIISEYEKQDSLVGKSLAEVQQELTYEDGYLVWVNEEDGVLVIHQRIEDWCPDDRDRVHLGLFKGHVAVFQGPKGFDEELLRITGIWGEDLPEKMRQDLETGILEYAGEDEANLVLENLDEYVKTQ